MLGFIWFSMAVKQLDSVKKRNLQRKLALEISNQHLFMYLFHNGNASFVSSFLTIYLAFSLKLKFYWGFSFWWI
jgi:hypothetical protein